MTQTDLERIEHVLIPDGNITDEPSISSHNLHIVLNYLVEHDTRKEKLKDIQPSYKKIVRETAEAIARREKLDSCKSKPIKKTEFSQMIDRVSAKLADKLVDRYSFESFEED